MQSGLGLRIRPFLTLDRTRIIKLVLDPRQQLNPTSLDCLDRFRGGPFAVDLVVIDWRKTSALEASDFVRLIPLAQFLSSLNPAAIHVLGSPSPKSRIDNHQLFIPRHLPWNRLNQAIFVNATSNLVSSFRRYQDGDTLLNVIYDLSRESLPPPGHLQAGPPQPRVWSRDISQLHDSLCQTVVWHQTATLGSVLVVGSSVEEVAQARQFMLDPPTACQISREGGSVSTRMSPRSV